MHLRINFTEQNTWIIVESTPDMICFYQRKEDVNVDKRHRRKFASRSAAVFLSFIWHHNVDSSQTLNWEMDTCLISVASKSYNQYFDFFFKWIKSVYVSVNWELTPSLQSPLSSAELYIDLQLMLCMAHNFIVCFTVSTLIVSFPAAVGSFFFVKKL